MTIENLIKENPAEIKIILDAVNINEEKILFLKKLNKLTTQPVSGTYESDNYWRIKANITKVFNSKKDLKKYLKTNDLWGDEDEIYSPTEDSSTYCFRKHFNQGKKMNIIFLGLKS